MSQKLARPRRRSDRVGHQNRELPHLHPDDVAHRQPRADPHVPEEDLQNTDDLVALQCTARQERQRRGTIPITNPVLGAFKPHGYVNRSRDIWLLPFTPRLFSHHFHIQCTAWTLGYLKRVVMGRLPHACLRFHHFDILSSARTQTCSRFLQSFAFPDQDVQLQLS